MLVGELDNTSGATDITSLTVHAGIDYHDDTIRVCVLNDEGEVLVNRDVNNNPGAVRDLVARYGIPKAIAIEACSGAAEFAEELRKQSQWSVRLAHPGYVRKLKQGPDKTDHGDAWLLADLVRVNYLPEVWLADEQTRQLRRLTHYRQGLAAERKNIKLRIRALPLRRSLIGGCDGCFIRCSRRKNRLWSVDVTAAVRVQPLVNARCAAC